MVPQIKRSGEALPSAGTKLAHEVLTFSTCMLPLIMFADSCSTADLAVSLHFAVLAYAHAAAQGAPIATLAVLTYTYTAAVATLRLLSAVLT